MNGKQRQEKIAELIRCNNLSDQMQIVELLDKEFHIKTNQAQVSRDLRKLGVVKRQSSSGMFYELSSLDVHKEILKLSVMSIAFNESMIVIKTRAGLAAFVGDYLDENFSAEILGCIAGENTVFVTPTTACNIEQLHDQIKSQLFMD